MGEANNGEQHSLDWPRPGYGPRRSLTSSSPIAMGTTTTARRRKARERTGPSEGRTLYCVGDLHHDPVEIAHPDWMVRWADPESNLASRRRFVEAAVAEEALLIATRILPLGRLERTRAYVTSVEA